jgi:hypothetical protein
LVVPHGQRADQGHLTPWSTVGENEEVGEAYDEHL